MAYPYDLDEKFFKELFFYKNEDRFIGKLQRLFKKEPLINKIIF